MPPFLLRLATIVAPLAALAAAPLPPTTVPSAPAVPEIASTVDGLIGQLAGDDWRLRQAAEDRLVRFGPEIKPRLEELVRQSKDEEVIARARAALRQIEENRVAGPTLLSLHFKDAPAALVFNEISRQSELELELPTNLVDQWKSPQAPRLTLNADHQAFWSVLLDACRQSAVEPHLAADRVALNLVDNPNQADWANFPVVVSGPLVIAATDMSRTSSVHLGSPRTVEHSFQITMEAMAEPKLRIQQGSASARVDEAVDENGNSLLIGDGSANLSSAGDNSHDWSLSFDLGYPPNAGKRIARLKGAFRVTVTTEVEGVDVPDPLAVADVAKVVGGKRFLIRKVQRSIKNHAYEVQLTVFRDGLGEPDWDAYLSGNPCEFVRLVDDAGKIITADRVESTPDGTNRLMNFDLYFDPPDAAFGKPAKLSWDVAVESRELTLPFEFADLPIP